MFNSSHIFTSFSVNNLEKAKEFYTNVLGLKVNQKEYAMELITNGNNPIMIYPKDNHISATYTVLNFPVDNIDQAVDELVNKGVKFEHYDEGMLKTDEKGITREGPGPFMAWFKDPAGNFLSLIQEK
jgi:catechol 2,3-dioxygenase-like lactoylglutathione lyase family enzyme